MLKTSIRFGVLGLGFAVMMISTASRQYEMAKKRLIESYV